MSLVAIFLLMAFVLAFGCNTFVTSPMPLVAKYVLAPVYGVASLVASFFVVMAWEAAKGASVLEIMQRLHPKYYVFTVAVFVVVMLLAHLMELGLGRASSEEGY